MKYYLAVDESVQWFCAIFKFENDTLIEKVNVSTSIVGDFLNNIFSREQHFTYKKLDNDLWSGWTISENEFNRIKKLVQLRPYVEEYNKLSQYS